MRLSSRVAIVTGGRRGIGKAIALAMAREGADIVVCDINKADCERVAQEIRQLGRRALSIKCDVSKSVEVERMVINTITEFGKIDILVNNAGIISFQPFLDISEVAWDRTISVNLKGQFLCAQAVSREMAKARKGRIINIASVSSGGCMISTPLIAHYTASKGGILGLTKAMAVELTPLGINVTAICPGAVETDMAEGQSGGEVEKFLSRIPKGRFGKPEEIADLAVFLASDEADYITGQAIIIDGGWLAA